ncbi:Cysteine and histidine-rich domain-containing protein [Operophtera brumata]|uniref:Cysteine and histidine-rich domain-containing protein n=1 Tax=Operophtera brumata TaxID=104452 RepID=A0A0L7L5G5_OPEBR|nr:Cysteine and histidine-rich domain-containing protein [Operophtera brumata]
MPESKKLVSCYNRGCGKDFDPNDNNKDECCHHPGSPVFHDAYKGWSCCNKKSVDFTEFLNIKGCTLSKHSNVKDVIEVRAPIVGPQLSRPPFDTPVVKVEAHIAESLKELAKTYAQKSAAVDKGTSYEGPHSNQTVCTYHPGVPIFHEGLKFWSCCQKRTTDFNVFLSQPGCTTGSHKWTKEARTVKCRWDWHQTPDNVIVSVYAKKYDPTLSFVKLNPIRLNTKLVFREEGDAAFELDLELRGLKKAEPGAWAKLDFPRTVASVEPPQPQEETVEEDDSVDLSTVEAIQSMGKVNMTAE